MAELLTKLLDPLISKSADPSLKQGARFNKMQTSIKTPVLGQLGLIGQTTGNGLGSLMEGMSNMGEEETKFQNMLKTMEKKQSDMNSAVLKKKGKKVVDALEKELEKINEQIMNAAEDMSDAAKKRGLLSSSIYKGMEKEESVLAKKMNMLKTKKKHLEDLLNQKELLDGQLMERMNQLDSSYIHYIVWFVCATTLGVLAARQLMK